MNKKIIGLFEIFTLLIASFSFAFIIGETNIYFEDSENNNEGFGILFLREKILRWLGNGIVSAQSNPTAMYTCIENVNGTICQEYPNTICDSVCVTPSSGCLQTTRENTIECQLGYCFESITGICSDGSPKFACESSGGVWSATPLNQCNRGCCLINPDGNGGGDQAQYTTGQECNFLRQTLGAPIQFSEGGNELECLARANSAVEGACVLEFLPAENAYNCEFTTQSDCGVSGGEFFDGSLCTSQNLVINGNAINTVCETTLNGITQTSCSEDGDEVYFVDSCGNKANIYDSTKSGPGPYWNAVVSKENSCSLGNSVDPFSNQDSCGNCDYLRGSLCGEQGVGDVSPDLGSLVCNDLRCLDYLGETRQNGESWCRFDGQIGLDGTDGTSAERSVDLPGSRHYREVCFDGEVRLEPCQDFRNEICVESENENSKYTSANCRINLWQQCMQANGEQITLNECEENTDCFLKHVNVDEYFEFDVCAPKYPPGFDLTVQNGAQVGESICSAASQTCTYIEQKGIDGWDCVANCDCLDNDFAEQMNNLCMSLGDCGASSNIAGEVSDDGYSVIGSDGLSSGYLNNLKQYKTAIPGQRVEPLSLEELAALLGIPPSPNGVPVTAGEIAGWVLGIGGLGMAASLVILEAITGGSFAFANLGIVQAGISEAFTLGELGPWANWAGAAAVGAAIGFILSLVLGLQGDAVLAVTLGGAAGGVVAYALGAPLFEGLFFLGIGIGIAVALILVFALGLGETREKQVDFTCRPWQPPTGGDNCDICNSDDLGCSKYKCDSLGQNCELINEGTSEALCEDVNPNDSLFPDIDILEDAIGEDYNYLNPQINVGTEIEFDGGDGCIKEYEPVEFGLELNEPGQCKWDIVHTSSYEGMGQFFGNPESNLYRYNHTTIMAMPTLDSLGVTGIDPGRRGDYDLYVRCQDSSGNWNPAEYNVRFCVKPADDVTAPIITEFIPESPGFVGLGVQNFNLQFYTNEPATCRWSSGDKSYEIMENNAICYNEISAVTLQGWRCLTQLPVSGNETETFYFRCADQPWLGRNSTSIVQGRNPSSQSTEYLLQKTATPLSINFIEPNGTTIYVGTNYAVVDLEIHTVGGIDNGNALCSYLPGIQFFESGGQVHKQNNLNLFEGSYNYPLQCTDAASNVATAEAIFDVEVDSTGPVITRYYQSRGTLNIVTNEPSQCAYSNENCAFAFEEGEQMSGSNYLHSTSFDPGLTYRVKCQDTFGNSGSCLSVSGGY